MQSLQRRHHLDDSEGVPIPHQFDRNYSRHVRQRRSAPGPVTTGELGGVPPLGEFDLFNGELLESDVDEREAPVASRETQYHHEAF
jgi:hypothetical protein